MYSLYCIHRRHGRPWFSAANINFEICSLDIIFVRKLMVFIMPKTLFGKWAVRFVVAFILLLATGIFVASNQGPRADQTFLDNPVLSIPMLSAGAAGILAFLCGIISVIKSKEHSILVIAATII